ncbi:MAG: radical SAM protein [Ghiorsea sp.]
MMTQQPHYIFLPDDSFILVIADQALESITLIHPLDNQKKLVLNGSFAELLFQQLKQPVSEVKSTFQVIEKQYPWLIGLASASLTPTSKKQMAMGDELGLLFLEITDQCNEKCIHCYASSSPMCSDFLSLEEITSVLHQARKLGRAMVQFTGGDPLIHRQLVEAVACAARLDFQGIEIYTNGLLLSDGLLQKLLPYTPSFAFSLYSPDAGVHDNISQTKGSFKKTIAAIHRTQASGLSVRIGMAIMEQNAGHEQTMLDFAHSEFGLTAEYVRFDPVHETGRGINLNTKHISLMPSQNSHMPPSLKGADNKEPSHHQVVQHDSSGKFMPSTTANPGRRGKLAICANGNVSPCIFNREHVLGNIRQHTLLETIEKAPSSGNLTPSLERWNFCQHNLSCVDCQMVAYTLGDKA